MPRVRPAHRPWLSAAAILGAWLLFMGMVMMISWGGAASRNRPFDLLNTAVWNLGWIWWFAATFLVRALGRRFPIEATRWGRMLALHIGFGLVVTTGLLSFEHGVNDLLHRLWPAKVRENLWFAFVVYKFHIYFLIYWLILGASGAYDYYTRLRRSELAASQLEAQLAQAQVNALKMQLHPHFLFNTHHSIVSLMLKNENAAAIKMLTRLSDLLRTTLRSSEQSVCALQAELAMIELYLGIQRERYRDRLTVVQNIAPDVLQAEVPCLLLQPLVENALQHGIDPQTSGGQVMLSAERMADALVIRISDNGPGVPPDFKLDEAKGVGLRNTRARLRCLYGDRQRFALAARPGGGTEVRVELPWREVSTCSHPMPNASSSAAA